jgi:hypothetical protein
MSQLVNQKPALLIREKSQISRLAERLERLIVNAKVATVLVRSQHPPTQWNPRGGR